MAAFSKCVVVGLTLVALGSVGGPSAWGATGLNGTRTVEPSTMPTAEARRFEVDDVKIAVDYLLGRNGRKKDVRTGIRLLVAAAERKPVAKRVFVRQWMSGNLDGAMDAMTDEEWVAVLGWFKEAFDAGEKKAGLLLGRVEFIEANETNRTDRAVHYVSAAKYWRAAGRAGCAESWYRLGNLVTIQLPKPPFSQPKTNAEKRQNQRWNVQFRPLLDLKLSDRDARYAYEHALKISPNHVAAKYELALLYLFSSDEKVADSRAAYETFTEFYRSDKTDKWHVYYYGLSGWCLMTDKMNADVYQRAIAVQLTPQSIEYDSWLKRINEYNALFDRRQNYVTFIERAAKMGCEPAQRFMSKLSQGQ